MTTQSNQSNTFIFYRLFLFSLPYFSNLDMLFFLRLRDVWRRSRWPADPRTTLCVLALTGSLPGERSSDFAVLHRRTGLTGYPNRSDRSEHQRCNCAVAHRAIKRIRVLALDWRQQIQILCFFYSRVFTFLCCKRAIFRILHFSGACCSSQ